MRDTVLAANHLTVRFDVSASWLTRLFTRASRRTAEPSQQKRAAASQVRLHVDAAAHRQIGTGPFLLRCT